MKTLITLFVTLFTFTAFAGQKNYPISDLVVGLKGNKLVAEGIANRKKVSGEFSSMGVSGSVAGKLCAEGQCRGKLSLNVRGEVILNAVIDVDGDGNIDGQEMKIIGVLHGGTVIFDYPVSGTYVEQRYSFVERAFGQKNEDYIALNIQL